jgi:ATP-dependent Clp protease ATP-binding subunit ClpA
MERVIQEHIKKPLAELVLFGSLAKSGGTALVRLDKTSNKLEVSVEESETELQEV